MPRTALQLDLFYLGGIRPRSPEARAAEFTTIARYGLAAGCRGDRGRLCRQPGPPPYVRAARLWRHRTALDYDWQGAYQIGSYAGLRVNAFAFNTDTGYTFHTVPWKPRIGCTY